MGSKEIYIVQEMDRKTSSAYTNVQIPFHVEVVFADIIYAHWVRN